MAGRGRRTPPKYHLPTTTHSRDIYPRMTDFKFNADGLISGLQVVLRLRP